MRRADLISCNRTKRLHWLGSTTVCDRSISATTLSVSTHCGGSSSGWVEGLACVALYREEAGGDDASFPS